MAKGLFGGMTDYSHQSFQDIITDLESEHRNVSGFIEMIEKNLAVVQGNDYWKQKVDFDFRNCVHYALKHYSTTKDELFSISQEIQEEVQEHHCKRLQRIAKVGNEINRDLGITWHEKYRNKEYGDANFILVERIYADSRDMAVNLADIANISERLTDFIGKKKRATETKEMKVLLLTASPEKESRLRVDVEARKIDEGLQAAKFRDSIHLIKKEAVKPDTITKAMLDSTPDIVHFSGHGDVDGIIIEGEDGNPVLFPVTALQRLFKLFAKTTKAVVLSACYSQEQAKAISELGIYVIGMSDSIDDEAAIMFSTGFYQAIGAGKEVPFAFEMGLVVISQLEDQADIPVLWKDGAKLS